MKFGPFLFLSAALATRLGLSAEAGRAADAVIQDYTEAVGGAAAVDRIETREIHAHHGRRKLIYYWQKPNKVVLVDGKKKTGYDGGSGWILSSKKRVSKLSKGEDKPLEMDANPLRYVHLQRLYSDLSAAAPENLDGRAMDVLVAPNERGATKFYFDRYTHLLVHIEETGETSAYYKHVTDFDDYKDQDGIKFPFRISHESNEPGGDLEEVRISEVKQNIPLQPQIFSRPLGGSVVLGGKR
jgi:hypothetical protein